MFFSSRRRHTRWTGDWSSDVCSSDLKERKGEKKEKKGLFLFFSLLSPFFSLFLLFSPFFSPFFFFSRSEERRVGKDCIFFLSRCYFQQMHDFLLSFLCTTDLTNRTYF